MTTTTPRLRAAIDHETARGYAVDDVVTTAALRAAGLSASTIAARCRPDGQWRRLFPGVLLLSGKEPSRRQLLRAAVSYVGEHATITGVDALRAHGLTVPQTAAIHLLVPTERRLVGPERLILERTTRMPGAIRKDGLRYAPAVRAVLDTARRQADEERLRTLLAQCLFRDLCTPEQLRFELDAGNQRGSAAVRKVLAELGATKASFARNAARALLQRVPLPPPVWDANVCDVRARSLGVVDAWWDEVALAWQLDGIPGSTRPSLEYLGLTAAGVLVLRTPVSQLRTDPSSVVKELVSAFGMAMRRARPRVYLHTRSVA